MKKIIIQIIIILIMIIIKGCNHPEQKHILHQDKPQRYFMQDKNSPVSKIPYGVNMHAAHWVKSDDAEIYYEVYGNGKPLVILHGGVVGSIQEMGRFIDSLSGDYKVIAISTRGHGKSEMGIKVPSYDQKALDVNAVLKQEGISKAIVLGFSDGAYTGYYFAKRYPEKIDRLIAIGAGEWKKGFRNFNLKYKILVDLDPVYWQQQLAIRPDPEKIIEWFISLNSYYNSIEIGDNIFKEVKCPVLILAGEKDENAPLNTILNAYDQLPDAQLAIIPDAPHTVFLINFHAVWACIKPFLR